ncbi:MAG: ADP-glyceromanno-heptose 6-epimerase [Saprospiraceae bacterium]|nr:ADP-glyceromanno-heptose 6-epimerase [Candidatus Opimibacter skivensis]
MIVVTGAIGFIGSAFVGYLNQLGYADIVVVDDFYQWKKEKNLKGKRVHDWVHRDLFIAYFEKMASQVDVVFHLGARTDTISEDVAVFNSLNLQYSKDIWRICTANEIPLVYASSAATYGDGAFGFSDDHAVVSKLKPLNAYAQSKQDFDQWVLTQKNTPPRWYGLKFFNVYGPNEYHKARMASVIFHAFHQIRDTGKLKLFKSHRPEWKDGGQERDFIYVKDVLEMVWNVYDLKPESALYNVGTGKARTFQDLGTSTFAALGLEPNIEYIDMPIDLREKYQYFTEADMSKWINAKLPLPATSLEEGVKDYIQYYLNPSRYL